MRRRQFITLLGGVAAMWPMVARGQQASHIPRLGVLMTGSKATSSNSLSVFKSRLLELGYVEDKTILIDVVWADGRIDHFPDLARQLIQRSPDIVVAPTTMAALAIKRIAPNLPTVFLTVADPIGSGLVRSYAHPGGSATGIQGNIDTLAGKQLEMLREILPAIRRVGMLVNTSNGSTISQHRNAERAALTLGVTLSRVQIAGPDDIETAFNEFSRQGVEAVMFPTDATVLRERKRVAELAVEAKLPSIFPYQEHVREGGLLSYGIDRSQNYRRAAEYVHKILMGDKPSELPVEFPTKLYLAVNLRTAKAIGLTIPELFLIRADEVIE